jgi:hypothetical protein
MSKTIEITKREGGVTGTEPVGVITAPTTEVTASGDTAASTANVAPVAPVSVSPKADTPKPNKPVEMAAKTVKVRALHSLTSTIGGEVVEVEKDKSYDLPVGVAAILCNSSVAVKL